MDITFRDIIHKEFKTHKKVLEDTINYIEEPLIKASNVLTEGIRNNKKVLICGNGGSSCDAQNMASELIGKYKKERIGLPAIALNDIPSITAIANDYCFDFVFSRQVEALAQPGDIFIGISTSGNSKNIINAAFAAKNKECTTIALTGATGGKLSQQVDISLNVQSNNSGRIQEIHILLIHIICENIESKLFK